MREGASRWAQASATLRRVAPLSGGFGLHLLVVEVREPLRAALVAPRGVVGAGVELELFGGHCDTSNSMIGFGVAQ